MHCKTPAQRYTYYTTRVCTLESTNKTVPHTLYAMIDNLISIFKFDKCEFITFMGTRDIRTENTFHEAHATVWLSNLSCNNDSSSFPVLCTDIPSISHTFPATINTFTLSRDHRFYLSTDVRVLRCNPSFHKSSYNATLFQFVVARTLHQR